MSPTIFVSCIYPPLSANLAYGLGLHSENETRRGNFAANNARKLPRQKCFSTRNRFRRLIFVIIIVIRILDLSADFAARRYNGMYVGVGETAPD